MQESIMRWTKYEQQHSHIRSWIRIHRKDDPTAAKKLTSPDGECLYPHPSNQDAMNAYFLSLLRVSAFKHSGIYKSCFNLLKSSFDEFQWGIFFLWLPTYFLKKARWKISITKKRKSPNPVSVNVGIIKLIKTKEPYFRGVLVSIFSALNGYCRSISELLSLYRKLLKLEDCSIW